MFLVLSVFYQYCTVASTVTRSLFTFFMSPAAGETVTIAEEMAARDALQRMMGLAESRMPLSFKADTQKVELDYDKENIRAEELIRKYELSQTQSSAA